MKKDILRIENITILDNGITILNKFYMNLFHGELLGIFVHNAAEKRHLIELLCGELEFEHGRLYFGCSYVDYEQFVNISKEKISLIQSTGKLIDDLTVADNIFIASNNSWHDFFKKREVFSKAQDLFEKFGLNIDSKKSCRWLSPFERVAVEITKAYAANFKIIIFKDLSGYLSDTELNQLVNIVVQLKKEGMSFVMIDSFVDILKDFSDRMLVVKNGCDVWTFKKEKIDNDCLGRCFISPQISLSNKIYSKSDIALRFLGVSTDKLQPLSFEIRSGEILFLLDTEGFCIDEIIKILNGSCNSFEGQIYVGDQLFHISYGWEALQKSIAVIVESPTQTMLFNDMSVVENLVFASIGKINSLWTSSRYLKSCIQEYEKYFPQINMNRPAEELTIYDQQKLVYLKWHLYNPRVVVCIRPFSSIDAELREITSEMLDLLMKKGIAIIVLGSNYSEMYSIGNKIDLRSKEVTHKS